MIVLLHILAQPLAPDNLWPVFLLLVTLALMAGLNALKHRIAAWRETRHHVRTLGQEPHTPISHRHH